MPYRTEGWAFLLAGGGLYNNLDYSFTLAHPDGTAPFTKSPGGGGPTLRRQLHILKHFIDSFDFIRMPCARQRDHPGSPTRLNGVGAGGQGGQYATI